MKILPLAKAIFLGVCVCLVAKGLTFLPLLFFTLDVVAGTGLNTSNPNVWHRVVGNPTYLAIATGIGFFAEFVGGYLAAKINAQRFYCIVVMVLTTIIANFVVNFDHPLQFNLLMIARVFVASCLGAFYFQRQMKRNAGLLENVAPIAPPR